jgi:drug/metabolite transporter (DMT)-like permease
MAAVVLTLLGLRWVVGSPGAGDGDFMGFMSGALAGATYGAYLVASERWLLGYAPLVSTAHMSLAAALSFGGAGLYTHTLAVPVGLTQWGVVAGMIVFPTLVAVPLLYAAIARLGAARASLLATTEPVWTVILAALVLGESVHRGLLIGGLLILTGAALSQRA